MASLLCFAVCVIVFRLCDVTHAQESSAFRFELRDNERTCFYQEWAEVRLFTFAFKVIRGGNRDVSVSIESPTGGQVFSAAKESEGRVTFETAWGVFTFCFDNKFSTVSHKVVYFELRPPDHASLADEAGRKQPTAPTQLEHSMDVVHDHNEMTKVFQQLYKNQEAEGRAQADALNFKVQFWSSLESGIIVLISLSQVWLLKRFFMSHTKTTANVHAYI